VIVTGKHYYDWELGIDSNKLRDYRQGAFRRVVDFEETKAGLLGGHQIRNLMPRGIGVYLVACERG
jgi:hypothetical protein